VFQFTGSIETLPLSLDGKEYELQELAQIIRKNPKTIVINMASFPQAIPSAIQAINKSGMNLNPQQDGTTLFIPIPKWVNTVNSLQKENLWRTLFIARIYLKLVHDHFLPHSSCYYCTIIWTINKLTFLLSVEVKIISVSCCTQLHCFSSSKNFNVIRSLLVWGKDTSYSVWYLEKKVLVQRCWP